MTAMVVGSLLPTMFGGRGHPEVVTAAAAVQDVSVKPADGNPGGSHPVA
jgi:hypothetical protein